MRRALGVAVVSVLVGGSVVVASPAWASDDALTLPGGESTVTLGANAVLRIDGRLQFDTHCSGENAVNDWGYAASDVYLTAGAPTAGATLEDVSGFPSTIIQPGSTFIDQIVAITQPSGTTGEGIYSIVYDTCQDGVYDPSEDTLYADVVTVAFPAELPPIDAALTALKTDANTEWGRWKQIGKLFDSLINVDTYAGCAEADIGDCLDLVQIWADSEQVKEWAETAGDVLDRADCAGGDASACFGLLAEYWGFDGDSIRDRLFGGVKSLIANQAKSFYGLYADPPRADYTTPTSAVVDLPLPATNGGGAILDAASAAGAALQREVALRQAFVTALERYQGAQGAGDGVWATAQLRSAAALADALADAGATTATSVRDIFGAVADRIPDFDALAYSSKDRMDRQYSGGFTPEVDRALRNEGNGVGTRGAYLQAKRTAFAGLETAVLENLGAVDDAVAAQSGEAARLRDAATQLRALAAALPRAASVPSLAIEVAGPGSVGAALPLTATASAGASVVWDLDGDGAFDDGTGTTVNPIFRLAGDRVVSAKATKDGVSVTAHAAVSVTQHDGAPQITSATPLDAAGKPGVVATVGQARTLSVTATDPEDEALRYSWFVDGVLVPGETAASFDYVPDSADRGAHTVFVTVQDPHPGNLAQLAWRVRVVDSDRDGDGWSDNAEADCADGDGDVHPGRIELLFNGKDDDCDTSTPDGGTDLGEGGDLWAWGSGVANPTSGGGTPTLSDRQTGNVVAVNGQFGAGWWLTSDGRVWGFGPGSNGFGAVGPTGAVYGIGSASGELSGIAELVNNDAGVALARTTDGRVVSWGAEGNRPGLLGAGAALWGRNYPDYVLGPDTTGDGAPDPLSHVTDVWQVGGAAIARTEDGMLWQWGLRRCTDTGMDSTPSAAVATPEPALAAAMPTIVQAAGDNGEISSGATIFRTADGSVFACGADRDSVGVASNQRLMQLPGFGPDNPAVDVKTYRNGFWVVTADGSVWVKSGEDDIHFMPGCTDATCPWYSFFKLPLPADWHVVDVALGGDYQLRLADGRLVTFSGENTFGSLGHGDPPGNPEPLAIDGYVISNATSVWNGWAVAVPTERLQAAGWTPPQPDVTVSATGASGPEGGTATAAITLDRPATGDLEVSWTLGERTGTTTVPAGTTHADVALELPAPDGVWGADRTLPFVLTGASSDARLGDEIATVTVTDADAPPSVAISPGSVAEGDATPTSRPLTATLSAPAAVDLTFTVVSADGTAVAGVDYNALSLVVTIPAGQTSASVPLIVRGNALPEASRSLTVTATSRNPAVAAASTPVTIEDDDPLTLTARAVTVAAGQPSVVVLNVPTLPEGASVTVAWHTADGTATAPDDYVAGSGTLIVGGASPLRGLRLLAAPGGTIDVVTSPHTVTGGSDQVRYATVEIEATAAGRTVIAPARVALGIRFAADDDGSSPTASPSPPTSSPTPTTGAVAGARDTGGLAGTGGAIAWPLLALGAAAVGGGVILAVRRSVRAGGDNKRR